MHMDSSSEKYSASQSQTTPPAADPLDIPHLPSATSQSLQHAAQGQPVHYLDPAPNTLPFEAPPPPPSSGDGVPALGRRSAVARWPGLTCPACGWRPVEPGATCPHCFALVPVAAKRAMPWRLITAGALALVVILSAILIFTLLHHGPSQPVTQTIAPGLHATTVPTATATTLVPTIVPTLAVSNTPSRAQPTSQPALPPGAQPTSTPTRAPAPTNTPTPQPIALPPPPAGASTVWPTLQTNGGTGCTDSWHTGNKGLNFVHTTGAINCYSAYWSFSGNQTCSVWVPLGQDIVNGMIWSPNNSIAYGAHWSNWSNYSATGINQQANVGNVVYLGAWANLQQVDMGTGTNGPYSLIEAGPLYYSCT